MTACSSGEKVVVKKYHLVEAEKGETEPEAKEGKRKRLQAGNGSPKDVRALNWWYD